MKEVSLSHRRLKQFLNYFFIHSPICERWILFTVLKVNWKHIFQERVKYILFILQTIFIEAFFVMLYIILLC